MRKNLLNFMDKVLGCLLVISTLGMILVVILQIVARYALPWSPHWTEEVARFCFIYMVSFGAGLALKDHDYVSVTTFLNKFSGKSRFYLEVIILLAVTILMLFMFIYSFSLLNIVSIYYSAALQINMAFIYFSMLIMSFFVTIYAILQLIEKLKSYRKTT